MPCDTIQTNTVDLPKMHAKMRDRALTAIGATVNTHGYFSLDGFSYVVQGGRLISRGASQSQVEATAARLKQAYSAEVVKYTAKKHGWTLKQTAPFQYQVQKG